MDKPIIVGANAGIMDLLTALGRYLTVIVTAIPILLQLLGSKDFLSIVTYFRSSDGAALTAAVVGLVTLLYGLYKTRKRGEQLVVTAEAAPDRVAQVSA